jgi:hypothetical protein
VNEPEHRRLLGARAASDHAAADPSNSCDEIASSHCLPEAQDTLDLACNLTRSNHEIETSEMGFNGQFCIAKISGRACLLWVKTRIHPVRAYVSFRRLRTCRWSAPLMVDSFFGALES